MTPIVETLFHQNRLDIIYDLLVNGYFDESEFFRKMINHPYYGPSIRKSFAVKGKE